MTMTIKLLFLKHNIGDHAPLHSEIRHLAGVSLALSHRYKYGPRQFFATECAALV